MEKEEGEGKKERSIQKIYALAPASNERGGDILAAKRVEIHADIPAI